MTFEPALLPDEEKENLCRALLDEFGATNVKAGGRGELIHGCLVSDTHSDQERNPTASLNYRKLAYSCLGCGRSGGLLWFISTCRNTSGKEARAWLSKEVGLDGEVMDLSRLLSYFDSLYEDGKHGEPIPKYSPKTLDPWNFVHPYLLDGIPELDFPGRNLPPEAIEHFRLGYAEDYVMPGGGTSERIIMPHFWKGDLVGWQARRIFDDGTPKYLSSPSFPKDQTIYNYDARREEAVVVESMMSTIKHWPKMDDIEATFGAKITPTQTKLLEKHQRIILWMDNDEAGWNAIDGTVDEKGNVISEGLGPYLGKRAEVLVVDSKYAADLGDLDTDTAMRLREEAVPYSIWSRPTELLCYRCEQVAHLGRCEE